MAILKTLLQQLASPSCRWGHKWGCWVISKEHNDCNIALHIIQARTCLICDFKQFHINKIGLM